MCRSLFWWIIFKRWFLQGFGRVSSNHGWCHRIRIPGPEGWKWSVGFDHIDSSSRVCNVSPPPPKKNRPFWAEIWHPFPEGVGWCLWNPALLCHLSARQPCLKSVACCPGAAAAGWSSIHHVNIFDSGSESVEMFWVDLYKIHPGNLT